MQKLPMTIIEKIDCAGTVMPSVPTNRICAASGTSYFMKDSWTIFFESNAIQVFLFFLFFLVSWKSRIFC